MTEHLDRKQSATDRTNHSVNGVQMIHPWNFVGEKFEQVENTGDADNPRVAEDFQRLILRPESRSSENGLPDQWQKRSGKD